MNEMITRSDQRPALPGKRSLTPIADHIAAALATISDTSPLPPLTTLIAARRELESALTPAPEATVEKAVAVLLAGYPSFKPEALYIAALVSDMMEFPTDAVMEATAEIRRTLKWPPTHAEILTAAEARVQRRKVLLGQIDRAAAELERRAQVEREAQAERRQLIDEATDAEMRIRNRLGADAPPVGCFIIARRFMRWDRPISILERFQLADQWERALEDAEPWAAATLWRAALIEQMVATNNPDQCAAILQAELDAKGSQRGRVVACDVESEAGKRPGQDWAKRFPESLCDIIRNLVDRDSIAKNQADDAARDRRDD